MKQKVNLSAVHPSKVMYGYLYPAYAKEFLFMNNYQQFAEMVSMEFILSPEQWEAVLQEWELKESILAPETVTPAKEGHKITEPVLPKTDAEYLKRRNEGQQPVLEGFTGGEWEARQSRGNNAYEWKVAVPGGRIICEMEATDLQDIKTVKANAALIAAAPELLKENRQLSKQVKYSEKVAYETSVANANLMAENQQQAKDIEELKNAKVELLKIIYHEIDICCISETENVSMTDIRAILVKHGANEPDLW